MKGADVASSVSETPPPPPPPPLGYDGRHALQTASVRGLLHALIDAEKAAALEGQDRIWFYNAHPLASLEVSLERCADGKLALMIQGLS